MTLIDGLLVVVILLLGVLAFFVVRFVWLLQEEVRLDGDLRSRDFGRQLLEREDEWRFRVEQLERASDKSRKDGLSRQKGGIIGDAAEKFCPFGSEYRYSPLDVVPIFNLCDYIVFVGRSTESGVITEVVFQDMKYNTSQLSQSVRSNQRSLKECIGAGRVKWETWRGSTGGCWSIDEEVVPVQKVVTSKTDLDTVLKQVADAKARGDEVKFVTKSDEEDNI